MATFLGQVGAVYVGANAVGELVSYRYQVEAEAIVEPALADAWDPAVAGARRWSGSAVVKVDPADTTGQGALTPGAAVTLNFYDVGNAPADAYRSGDAVVVSRGRVVERNRYQTFEITFVGNGALTELTVP